MDGYAQMIGSLLIIFVIVIFSHRLLKKKKGSTDKNPASTTDSPTPSDTDQTT